MLRHVACRFIVGSLIVLCPKVGLSATLHVPADHPTIQGCIDAAASGVDECVVAPGTYAEAIDFDGKAITLRSSGGPAVTTIDGNGVYHVVQCVSGESSDTVIEGFTITGGNATGPASPGDSGGGLLIIGSAPRVSRCRFISNVAVLGSAIANLAGSDSYVVNCSFSGNSAAGGCLYNSESACVVTSCTFTGNSLGAAIRNNNNGNLQIANSVIWQNYDEIATNTGATVTVSYSNVYDGLPGVAIDAGGNVDFDPLFVDAAGADEQYGTSDDDLRLSACSPVIDAGDNTLVPLGVLVDWNGDARVVDDPGTSDTGNGTQPIIDMGAFEYQDTSPTGGNIANVTQGTDHCTIQTAINRAASGDEIVVPPGTYVESINFAGKAIALRSSGGASVTTLDGDSTLHVVRCVSGEGLGTLLEGFTVTGGAATGVAGDHSYGGGMLIVQSSPSVSKCIFSANTASFGGGAIASFVGNVLVKDSVFIGNSSGFAGGAMSIVGGDFEVVDCIFLQNVAEERGGGIETFVVSALVADSLFVGNAAFEGGGMTIVGGDTQVIDSVFSGNLAEFGGGIWNAQSDGFLTNTTFAGNRANVRGGALYNLISDPTVENCVLWNNVPDEIYNDGANHILNVRHSCIADGLPAGTIDGGGNIEANPLFVDAAGVDDIVGTEDDDLRLRSTSPCVDAGDNGALGLSGVVADLAGNDRFFDVVGISDTGNGEPPIVDMGAFEVQCGNAIVEPGESCDKGIATAACDTDCTLVACGDGLPNNAAGEECDDGGESIDCDADCTTRACGDGTVNVTSGEECDEFGETANCDADCTLASCGDGTLNVSSGESCDASGETVDCDFDCTRAECGDGTINATAGEECDDGNSESHDGCSSTCLFDTPAIPTVSTWGMMILALLLLSASRIRFRRTLQRS